MLKAKITYTNNVRWLKFKDVHDLQWFVHTEGDHVLNYKIMGDDEDCKTAEKTTHIFP